MVAIMCVTFTSALLALKRADLGLWHGHVVSIHAAQHATGHAHSGSGCQSLPVLSQTYA